MKTKTLWLVAALVTSAALALASCAPAQQQVTTPTAAPSKAAVTPAQVQPVSPTTPTTSVAPVTSSKPVYGGTITTTVPNFNAIDTYRYDINMVRPISYISEMLAITDWAVDPKLYSFPTNSGSLVEKYMKGQLLESWEAPDPLTFVLHVRKGINWQNKPPVNGREFTADDIIWNLERYRKDPFVGQTEFNSIQSINKKDKWTVELKMKPPPQVGILRNIFDVACLHFWPKEATGQGVEITDWHNVIGTGPYTLEDYVPDSAATLKKNPNYWGRDERYPEYQLPYADFVKVLIIADPSTKYAAMRSGKLDWAWSVQWQDADSLLKSTPRLQAREVLCGNSVFFNLSYKTAPFSDVRVRQALNMAIDRNEIIKSLYAGHAYYYTPPNSEATSRSLYLPYEKLPDKPMWTSVSAKEVVTYNPDKAKKLLAEAGFPNGFKTHIDTTLSKENGISEMFQAYLAKIGVQAQINVIDFAAFDVQRKGKTLNAILLHWPGLNFPDPLYNLAWMTTGHVNNNGDVSDPNYDALYAKAMSEFDDAKREKIELEMEYRYVEMAYSIYFPNYNESFVWQPWIKGYAGEGPLAMMNEGPLLTRVWVDQKLKKSLGF